MKGIIMNYKLFTAAIAAGAMTLAGCGSAKTDAPKDGQKKAAMTMQDAKFSEVDINKDGQVTYDEFDKITDNKGDKEGNFIYVEMDKNGDGIISAEEFSNKAPATKTEAMKEDVKTEKK